MSEKTIPLYDNFVRKLFNRSGDFSKDFTHAILGIVTEVHEYHNATDAANGLEELGDLTFYLTALKQVVQERTGQSPSEHPDHGDTLQEMTNRAFNSGSSVEIAAVCNTLLDDAKRWVGYGKEPKSLWEVLHTATAMVALANLTGPYPVTDIERIVGANMAKLLVRYPGGEFSQYHALVRNLEAERGVLQAS